MRLISEGRERNWYLVEEWTTKAGLNAMICQCVWNPIVTEVAPSLHPFYTGYVRLPEGDNRKYYDTDLVDVHGGITFMGERPVGSEEGRWTGFDMAHLGDENRQDLSYVRGECENLAQQIQNINYTIRPLTENR